jgi:hypothetical protein
MSLLQTRADSPAQYSTGRGQQLEASPALRFRGIEKLEWRPASILNVIVGPGDSRKSTFSNHQRVALAGGDATIRKSDELAFGGMGDSEASVVSSNPTMGFEPASHEKKRGFHSWENW